MFLWKNLKAKNIIEVLMVLNETKNSKARISRETSSPRTLNGDNIVKIKKSA